MVAGVISKVLPAALAPEELPAQRGGTASQNGSHGAPMRRQQTGAKLAFIRRPVPAQDFGQREQRPERLRGEWLVELGQGGLGARFAEGRQMRVDDGGVQRLVSEILADLAQ